MYTVLCGYLLGWVMTTIGLALTIRKLSDPARPQPHPIPLAVAAGAAWPLVILGAAEMATVAIVVEAARRRTRRYPTRATPPADRPRWVDHSNRR
jgi:ABC-type Mn2+/Zn2+ transport system permease subunit